jgi:hypothetical protein
MEFPAACVVMSPSTAKGIIDFLTASGDGDNERAQDLCGRVARNGSLRWRFRERRRRGCAI